MREELLGYLLGALEPDEMQRVSEALKKDARLRAELDALAAALRPLDEAEEIYEPPGDLVARTMAAIPPAGPGGGASEAAHLGHGRGGAAPRGRESELGSEALDGRQGWNWVDVLATVAATVLLAGLILPGILRQRSQSRQQVCQDQLWRAGAALFDYAMDRPDGRMPRLAIDGPEAFAGYYAVELREAGRLRSPLPLWCPSLDVPQGWVGRPIPTRSQLREAAPGQLIQLQHGAGGHYAYSLGILEDRRYRAPRYQGRSYFAVLADAPVRSLDGWVTAHEGRGCNILFEDGHVAFLSNWEDGVLGDHPFLNRSGELAHGLDPDDAALAPSHLPPFQQRPGWSPLGR
jgi:prepilin-type processing-associated H-X9-DG protein